MKNFKSISTKLRMIALIPFFCILVPLESKAQEYSYRIIERSEIRYIGGGIAVLVDICRHGPGLCGPSGGGIQ
jgi:hypothetical protein